MDKFRLLTMQLNKSKFYTDFLYKISDDHFYNALKITLSAAISFGLFYEKYGVSVAFGMTLGASLCSPIDTSSSLKDKVVGIGITAILLPLISVVLTLLYGYTFFFYIVFALIVFFSAFISLYGQRASQMSFALLLGLCLSFIHITNTSNAFENGLYMFYGGMLYLCISVIFYLLKPTKFINLEVAICIDNVAKYLQLRSQLWGDKPDVEEIKSQQLTLQVAINDSFRTIDQYLDYSKARIVNSENNRKIILATSFLNDIMELAVSTTFSSKDIELQVDKYGALQSSIKEITAYFGANLEELSQSMRLQTIYTPIYPLTDKVEDIQNEVNSAQDLTYENKLYIDTIISYLNKQIKKIQSLECVCTGKIDTSSLSIDFQDVQKYFVPNKYRFKTLLDNLNLQSSYFRYAMRITIAMVIGLSFGDFIALKKEYWVLLTIVVIMRPGYGLTRARLHKRVLGTVIGGVAGIIILYFVTNTLVLMLLTAIAMLLGYWYSSSDYKIGVTFTTLYIILIYGLLKTGADISVVYRITDTLTGALIALLATNFLWPTWEFVAIKKNLIASINSTIAYINQFKVIYIQKMEPTFEVQQARQDAFVAIGNLMASYQRLVQEPKDKQQNRAELYKIALLNQSIVDAVASLGSFFRSHEDSDILPCYENLLNTIIYNLNVSLQHFGQQQLQATTTNALCTATNIANLQIEQSKKINLLDPADTEGRIKLEESQVVLKQFSWIVDLAEQLEKTASVVK